MLDYVSNVEPYVPFAQDVLLKVDPNLEDGHVVENDPTFKAYVFPCSSASPPKAPYKKIDAQKTLIPLFRIGLDVAMFDDYRSEVVEHNVSESAKRCLDLEVLRAVSVATPAEHTITLSGHVNTSSMNLAFSLIEEHDLTVKSILVHPSRKRQVFEAIRGKDLDADVYVSTMVPHRCVWCLGDPSVVGRLVESSPIQARYYEEDIELQTGHMTLNHMVVEGEYGVYVLNGNATSVIRCY